MATSLSFESDIFSGERKEVYDDRLNPFTAFQGTIKKVRLPGYATIICGNVDAGFERPDPLSASPPRAPVISVSSSSLALA